jgi:energy-converting hydrogenase Eha subunit G
MANFGTVLSGTVGGMAAAGAAFYLISIKRAFGGTKPVDQNERWQVKTEDMMVEGKWVRRCTNLCLAGL